MGSLITLGNSSVTYIINEVVFYRFLSKVIEIIGTKLALTNMSEQKVKYYEKEFCRGPVDGFCPNGPYI